MCAHQSDESSVVNEYESAVFSTNEMYIFWNNSYSIAIVEELTDHVNNYKVYSTEESQSVYFGMSPEGIHNIVYSHELVYSPQCSLREYTMDYSQEVAYTWQH